MTDCALRAKIRELMASGVLPSAPPVIERAGRGTEGDRARMVVDNPRAEPCAICGDSGPAISYFWPGGVVVHVHAACDAIWKQERERSERQGDGSRE
jgi:hypothetical protein